MSALPIRLRDTTSLTEAAIARLDAEHFTGSEWVASATRGLTYDLTRAVEAGDAFRVASAVRGLTHRPSKKQIAALVTAACDALALEHMLAPEPGWNAAVAKIDRLRAIALTTLDDAAPRPSEGAARQASVDALAGLMRATRPQLARHAADVSALARRIALALNLPDDTVERTASAALLHDIALGSDETTEPGPAGYRLAENAPAHADACAAALDGVELLADLGPIVRYHHERFDGTGAHGLAGTEIPVEARILSVADRFCGFGAGSDPIATLNALRGDRGQAFDPIVVTALCDILQGTRSRTAAKPGTAA